MKLIKKIIYKGKLTLLSGLHIGDSKESIEIGGVDSPVVRRKDTNQPYIPGSSLKGKIRSLLEIALGENADTKFKSYKTQEGKLLERLFGSADYTAKILVRDAYLTKDEIIKDENNKDKLIKGWDTILRESEFTDMPYTEIKFENVIDRLTGTAKNGGIRQIERIPAGAEFNIEFIINICDNEHHKIGDKVISAYQMSDKESQFENLLMKGVELLNQDYLGGSGTRGYGQVQLKIEKDQEIKMSEFLTFNDVKA